MAYRKTKDLISSFRKSGLTQKGFCAKEGISLSALQYHLYKSKSHSSLGKDQEEAPSGSFIPLRTPDSIRQSRTRIIIIDADMDRDEIKGILSGVIG
jgi:hypothetical protein